LRQPLARDVRFLPLVLVFLQLLQVGERGLAVGIELEHFGERGGGAINKSAPAIVRGRDRVECWRPCSSFAQARPLHATTRCSWTRASDLALLPIQIAKDETQLERRRDFQPRSFLQILDRQIHLAGHEMIQAED
jgi:hypothetical protein